MLFWNLGLDMNKGKIKERGDSVADSFTVKAAGKQRQSWLVSFLFRLVKEKPLGVIGAVITLLLLFTAIFSGLLAPYGMNQIFRTELLVAPSAKFWLGTDNFGRDILSRIIFGARISVIVGLAASTIAAIISAIIGTLSGYIGGTFDLLAQRFIDAWMSFPGLVLLIFIISMVGPGMLQLIFVLGLLLGIGGSRVIRGAVIAIKENKYVEAAVATGCPTSKILTRHILPNIMAPIIILFSTNVPRVILIEASLSFLGYGIPPPAPSWGAMLGFNARRYMFQAWWMAAWPGLALSIVVFGVNVLGDAVRDLLDPRLRGGTGRYGVRRKRSRNKK